MKGPHPSAKNGRILGYATASPSSAAVMALIDAFTALIPHRADPAWHPVDCRTVLSWSGLGDLIIQLPLIEGLLAHARRKGNKLEVALRPDHLCLGRRLGWPCFPLENPLQLFFSRGPLSVNPRLFRENLKTIKLHRSGGWVDLSGNALASLMLRWGGAAPLAARTDRGGRHLVGHTLPPAGDVNQHEYYRQLAAEWATPFDIRVHDRLSSRRAEPGTVAVCLTTPSSWRTWPPARWLDVFRRLPDLRFVLLGHERELGKDAPAFLRETATLPHVEIRLDHGGVLELADDISSCALFAGNDSSGAHLARAMGKQGVVLFGPGSAVMWDSPGGLVRLHDTSCPHYPCVQWKCHQPDEWCMEKISPDSVVDALRACCGPDRQPAG